MKTHRHHLIAGSSTLLLTGLRQILSKRGEGRVTQISLTEDEILQLYEYDPPDFFWMEPSEIKPEILLFCQRAAITFPKLKTIIFCHHKDPKTIREFLRAGIAAYLLPSCTTDRIEEAILTMRQGDVYIDPALHRYITDFMLDPNGKKKIDCCSLTRREKEVLRLIVEEHTTQEIANKLYINFCTVETHRLHLIQKMGVKNTAGLVREALVRQLYAHP